MASSPTLYFDDIEYLFSNGKYIQHLFFKCRAQSGMFTWHQVNLWTLRQLGPVGASGGKGYIDSLGISRYEIVLNVAKLVLPFNKITLNKYRCLSSFTNGFLHQNTNRHESKD